MKLILKVLFGSFVPPIKNFIRLFSVRSKNLNLTTLVRDFFSVGFRVGFVIVPALLVAIVFILLPQGRDTILQVVEKVSEGNYVQLFFLLGALALWSIFSELGVRYSIYISDNSGKSLTNQRVEWRKFSQQMLAAAFLIFPGLMIMLGLISVFITTLEYESWHDYVLPFAICLFSVYYFLTLLTRLYFHKSGNFAPGKYLATKLGERSLPNAEQSWVRKLYGIYNDYTYTFPKYTNYRADYRVALYNFTSLFLKNPAILVGFPQDNNVLVKTRVIPADFVLVTSNRINDGKGDVYKWTYFIPSRFYKGLHSQIRTIASISLVGTTLIAFIPADWQFYGTVGAPALVCLAFAFYTGIYVGLLYIDRALLRKSWFSVRFLLGILLIVSSAFNQDHPVRMSDRTKLRQKTIAQQYESWFHTYKILVSPNPVPDMSDRKYPVIFICAEGGAFRTGAYTGLFLTQLEDTLSKSYGIDFRKAVFAMSGVSGGAVGLSFYNALAFRSGQHQSPEDQQIVSSFFSYDALSPVVGKMLFGEFLNLFWPFHVAQFDRAIALEKSWEYAYAQATQSKTKNVFSEQFIDEQQDSLHPLLVINTTEVETGLQCWLSTLKPDSISLLQKRDLLFTSGIGTHSKVGGLNYSTAVNFSSRFPILSPAARTRDFHYVDGGYVENTGATSMLEILQLLDCYSPSFRQTIPIVVYLRFGEDSSEPVQRINLGSEFTEIVQGIYNTRSGRSEISLLQLTSFVDSHQGINIDQPLAQKSMSVPNNWMLSGNSIRNVKKDIREKIADTSDSSVICLLKPDVLHYPLTLNKKVKLPVLSQKHKKLNN